MWLYATGVQGIYCDVTNYKSICSLLDDCMSKGRLYDAAEIAVLELCKAR